MFGKYPVFGSRYFVALGSFPCLDSFLENYEITTTEITDWNCIELSPVRIRDEHGQIHFTDRDERKYLRDFYIFTATHKTTGKVYTGDSFRSLAETLACCS